MANFGIGALAAKSKGKKPLPTRAVDLLAWYDQHRRALPWRTPPGKLADPYRVWLSEIMLQQTTVKAVAPYYARFLQRWPDLRALAAAPLDDILRAWAGLGYYARARNLHACARAVVERHGAQFPASEAVLRELPGIGAHTAAAGNFRTARTNCAHCRASAPTRRRPSRRSPMTLRPCRWMAISSESLRGFMPSRRRYPPPSPRSAGWQRRCRRCTAPAISPKR